ncbi:MAG: hypothetical protein WC227_02450 [Patescibacteria group bacterium]
MVLFLDMNSFFASVEQQVQPTLRGRPIGVSPYTGESGCIIAASYEAKQRGVRICRNGEAKKLCPEIKIVEARPALYMLYHKEIRRVIEKFTPFYDVLSIDEFAIYLTPLDQNREKAIAMAIGLKKAIQEEVGDYLRCSVGISSSIFLAKMAGERQKPDGLTTLELKNLRQFYAGLRLTDLTGINWRLEIQLKNFGINSPLDLFDKPVGELARMLNHWGKLWYFRLRGHEVDDYAVKNKTIGHSCVLAPEFRSKLGAMNVIRKLVSKAGFRLRRQGYQAAGVSVTINFMDRSTFHISHKCDYFSDNWSFLDQIYRLLGKCPWQSRPILVAISSFNLRRGEKFDQLSFLRDIEKAKKLSDTIDGLSERYGADSICQASSFGAGESAPDRIPFGRPRYDIRNY